MTATIATPASTPTSPPRIAAAVVAVVVTATLAVAGGWLAILALAGGGGHGGLAAAVGDEISTSFGTLTVERANTLDGLTAEDLGGVTHGINDLVLSDSAQEEVSILLTNTGGSSARVDPDQFRLIVADTGKAFAPSGSTVRPMTLDPGASLGASLTFVVPRSGAEMSVRYTDPGSAAQVSVALGRLDQAPAGGDPTLHSH
jgi:hypothetical protein